jgi:hypothetical protein
MATRTLHFIQSIDNVQIRNAVIILIVAALIVLTYTAVAAVMRIAAALKRPSFHEGDGRRSEGTRSVPSDLSPLTGHWIDPADFDWSLGQRHRRGIR